MSQKRLAVLLRARMRSSDQSNFVLSSLPKENQSNSEGNRSSHPVLEKSGGNAETLPHDDIKRGFNFVRESMHSAISLSKTEIVDTVLDDFSKGYFDLSHGSRCQLLLLLAEEYDVNRKQVRELIKQYLALELDGGDGVELHVPEKDGVLSTFYRVERNLRHALKPAYEVLFERLNTHPDGLKFLSTVRTDILSILAEENIPTLRALDSYLKEKLSTWLSPATLKLHQITWDDSASLLEKIVAYEAVHPISNLLDLKRRLGVGRRCFGYFHPAIPGEPLIFIEVALLKTVAQTIQEVLWENPALVEKEATCALFYSISSTQPGLAGINLGKFLIKRVITLVKRDMVHVSTFATLSPIPGYMQWLLSKLASQLKLVDGDNVSHSSSDLSSSTFWENILSLEEERSLRSISEEFITGRNGMEILLNLLTSKNFVWADVPVVLSVLKPILLRLCARYLLQEKKRGKALDSVANFHLQNGAMVERINWMADRSEKGICQSGGIMVNYVYKLDRIEEYANSYFSSGHIHASSDVQSYLKTQKEEEATASE